jgi:hypothetical protein
MMIDLIPAILATPGANLAPLIANSATDGAQIHTDAEAGDVAAFAAIFEQLSQAIAMPEATPSAEMINVPTLPDQPVLLSDVQETEIEEVDAEEKPKESITGFDAVTLPPPFPTQPVETPKSTYEPESQLINPAAGQGDFPEKPKQRETKMEALQIPKQVSEEIPVPDKDDSAPPTHPKAEQAKIEFILPQPHLVQNEIEAPTPRPSLPPEQAFIQFNHPKILTAMHSELLPNGGSMHIRLDPPELGALAVQIDVRDGIVTASFQTSNDEATRLLSHSLGQLRSMLESAGVNVEKLQVQQAPREHFNSNSQDRDRSPNQQAYDRSAHDDQQRREMLQRMWRRLTIGRDMLDLVA